LINDDLKDTIKNIETIISSSRFCKNFSEIWRKK